MPRNKLTRSNPARTVWVIIILGLIVTGGGLIYIFSLPFEAAKNLVNVISKDGDLESFTPALYHQISGLKWVGLGLLVIGGASIGFRKKSTQVVTRILSYLTQAQTGILHDIRSMGSALRPLLAEKWHLLLLAIIVGVAIVNSAQFLSRPMRYDEAYTYNIFASKPLIRVISDYSLPNNHIFHSILVHFSTKIFGNHPWTVRLPAFIAGILLVPTGYIAARMFFSSDAALLGSGLIAFFSILVEYTTNGRGYTILGWVTLCLAGLGAYVKSHKNRTAWGLMIFLSVVGFYTVPTMLYPFGAVGLWLFIAWVVQDISSEYGRKTFILYLALLGILTAGLTALLYVPVLVVSGYQKVLGNNFVSALAWGELWGKLLKRLAQTWVVWNRGVPVVSMVFLVVGLSIALIFERKISRQRISFPMVMILFSGAVILIQRVAPFDRMWLFAVPILLLWSAAGLNYLFRKLIGLRWTPWTGLVASLKMSLLVTICASLIYAGSAYHHKRSEAEAVGEEVALFLADHIAPGEVVVTTFPDDAQIRYYLGLYATDPGDLFSYDGDKFQTAIVILSPGLGQSIQDVLEKQNFPPGLLNLETAELIYQYKHLDLYAVDRQ